MDINAKVTEILDNFGMKDKKAAEFMGMSVSIFKAKKAQHNYNKFKPEELIRLISYIREQTEKLP